MIVTVYAALLALIFIGLSLRVVRGRQIFRVPVGDGGEAELLRRIRAQANFAEYTPLFIILLTFAEKNALPPYAIHIFGVVFILGRLSHAYSILKYEPAHHNGDVSDYKFRILAMNITVYSLALLAFTLLVQYGLSFF